MADSTVMLYGVADSENTLMRLHLQTLAFTTRPIAEDWLAERNAADAHHIEPIIVERNTFRVLDDGPWAGSRRLPTEWVDYVQARMRYYACAPDFIPLLELSDTPEPLNGRGQTVGEVLATATRADLIAHTAAINLTPAEPAKPRGGRLLRLKR